MTPLAQQTPTDTSPPIEIEEPARPITDWLVDLFNADDSGAVAEVFSAIIEPVLQVILIVILAFIAVRTMRWMVHRVISGAKKDQVVSALGDSLSFGNEQLPFTRPGARRQQHSHPSGREDDAGRAVAGGP